ncbi:hypothetical protein RUM44_008567 [Polyplax serrata]|uniref:Uncharacterized protein n=1 Tax=Polyplax serrata TaxID=468196 RepID=A0ABR1BAJ3_POLSC
MQGNDPNRKVSSPSESIKNVCLDGGMGPLKSPRIDGTSTHKDVNRSIDRSLDKNSSDQCYDLGVGQESNDGTDSGVEVIRALSSNGSNSDRFTPIQSCGSSLVSYTSEPEIDRGSECGSESSERGRVGKGSEWKTKKSYLKTERSRIGSRKTKQYDGEGTSESCSETSSTHEVVTPDQLSRSIDFSRPSPKRLHDSRKSENSKTSLRRSESVSRTRTYEKPLVRSHSSVRTSSSSAKVNSASGCINRLGKSSGIYGKSDATGPKVRAEDGRRSFSQRQSSGARIRVSSVADPTRRSSSNTVMTSSLTSAVFGGCATKNGTSEDKSNALDKYGTLPRRPKKKAADTLSSSVGNTSLTRSNSVSREPCSNRAAALRSQRSRENSSNSKSLPPYPKMKKTPSKTIIYHEVSVQTIITNEDMNGSCTGICINERKTGPNAEKESRGIQTDGKERLKKMEDDLKKQSEEMAKFVRENEKLKEENRWILAKISKLLGRSDLREEEPDKKELEELEQHVQAIGLTVIKQQEELSELRRYKLIAHRDLEKSLAAQKNLLQQQQEIEEEYSELHDFLQAEKTALSESLLDTEAEIKESIASLGDDYMLRLKRLNGEIAKKETQLEQQQEECKHLVRICEQRRQENLSLETKLAGLDQRSRDVLVQQGAAVSAAAVALSGLGARLDTLVEQLSVSCNISEKDLEDIIFHNEAYNKSEDNSPCEPHETKFCESPKRPESFLQVILGALKNATHTPFYKKNSSAVRKEADHLAFFDAESEPCMATDTTPVSKPKSEEREKGVEGEDEDGEKSESFDGKSDFSRSNSLQNLSDAILNRQLVEKNEGRGSSLSLNDVIPIEVNSLVDQIIDVDNLVTKLLKVIKIIQEEGERRVEKLEDERAMLADQLTQGKQNNQKMEASLQRLQQELTDARSQLNVRISQLEEAKALCGDNQRVAVAEMQKRFAIIDTALGALNSVQDMVNKCPPLAQLRQDLEDCNFENSPGQNDVNANSPNGTVVARNGAVLTTAI